MFAGEMETEIVRRSEKTRLEVIPLLTVERSNVS